MIDPHVDKSINALWARCQRLENRIVLLESKNGRKEQTLRQLLWVGLIAYVISLLVQVMS